MKNLIVFVLVTVCARIAVADIQDPPSNDYFPISFSRRLKLP